MTTHRIVSTLTLLAALGSTLAHAQTGMMEITSAAIPITLVYPTASEADVLVPRFHWIRVLKVCGSCKAIDTLAGANHFDVLSPWPEAIGRPMAAQGGGADRVNSGSKFDRTRLPASYQRIDTFFAQNLVTTKP